MDASPEIAARDALTAAWAALGGEPDRVAAVELQQPERVLESCYDVSALATGSVAAASLALAEWSELAGKGRRRAVGVDGSHAAAAFACERLLGAVGWELPAIRDPFAGDYRTGDGFVRLHTNYAHHREAVLAALDVPAEREAIARAVASRSSEEVEQAVVAAGGCAAALRSESEWAAHPAGRAAAAEPLVYREAAPEKAGAGAGAVRGQARRDAGPLAGLRVLDLTRVIAGPVATRFLAAYGADVLRIDPPGFAEVPALLPETTAGKRCAMLDLKSEPGRRRFDELLAGADVLVVGLRSDALERLGYPAAVLRVRNPGLVLARVDAYGYAGPWRDRRGFDSLVQMSAGIAARGMRCTGSERPFPLPVQALDHASGYLLAAAVLRAVTERARAGAVLETRLSLARVARFLVDLGAADALVGRKLRDEESAELLEPATSAWGPIRRVRCPGAVEGARPGWPLPPAPLGGSQPTWLDA